MKSIHPTAWLSLALLTLCLFDNRTRAQMADLSKAPVAITLSNGIVFKLFGMAKDGKSVFPEGGLSEESLRSLFTNGALARDHFSRNGHHLSFQLIYGTVPVLEPNNTNSLFFRWVDENGYESLSVGHVVDWTGSFRGKEEAKTVALFTYPSRSRVMKLRIYSNSGPQGEVSLRNPFPGDVAPWPETTLPQELYTNDVTIKLLEANCRMEPATNLRPADDGLIKPWTELKLQMLSHGQVDTNWSLRSISASDATGNSIVEFPLTGPVDRLRYYDVLWPVEPIRYRVGLLREYHFPSNECVLIRGVTVPRKGPNPTDFYWENEALNHINFNTNIMDQAFEFIGFQNDRRLSGNEIPPDHALVTRDKIARELQAVSPVKGNDRIMIFKFPFPGIGFKVRMYDESDGSEIKVVDGYTGNHKNYFVTFIPEKTRTVTLLVANQKPVYVEFTTKPKIIGNPPEPLIK